jgi:DNA polymerase
MGSTAAQSLLGPTIRIMQARGQVLKNTPWAPVVVVTIHPSAVLRADDGEALFKMLVDDLKVARKASRKSP